MDPRVKTPAIGLQQQFTLSKGLYDGVASIHATLRQVHAVREQVTALRSRAATMSPAASQSLADFDTKAEALEGRPAAGFGGGRGGAADTVDTLNSMSGGLSQLMAVLQGADAAPTTQLAAAVAERRAALAKVMAQWTALKGAELAALNAKLKAAGLPLITVDNGRPATNQP